MQQPASNSQVGNIQLQCFHSFSSQRHKKEQFLFLSPGSVMDGEGEDEVPGYDCDMQLSWTPDPGQGASLSSQVWVLDDSSLSCSSIQRRQEVMMVGREMHLLMAAEHCLQCHILLFAKDSSKLQGFCCNSCRSMILNLLLLKCLGKKKFSCWLTNGLQTASDFNTKFTFHHLGLNSIKRKPNLSSE